MLTWPGEVAFESVAGGAMTEGPPGSKGNCREGSENWDPVPGSEGAKGRGVIVPIWGFQAGICRTNEML